MTVARIKRTTSSESQEQKALFQWAGLAEQKYPELKLLHHIPNGGIRDIRTAANLKKKVLKEGFQIYVYQCQEVNIMDYT